MVAFYNHNEDQAGFHFDGTTWTRFGPPLTGDPSAGGYNVSAAAAVASNPLQVYAIEDGTNVLSISSDGGLTWTQRTITGLATSPTPSIFSLWARAVGEVYLLEARGNASMDGIWRTLDDGLTWTRIVPFADDRTLFGAHMAVGTSKLFYAQKVALGTGSSPRSDTWHFNRCNLDGSGIETWATYTFTQASTDTGGWGQLPSAILLRAISDDFVIAANFSWNAGLIPAGFIWNITASGITDVRPTGLNAPWDAVPLTATQWLAVGNVDTFPFQNVLVYRTTDAGATWTLATTIPGLQGFARNGRTDNYFMISAPQLNSPSDVVMLGHADFNVQQMFWISADAGVTWTSVVNAADPLDGSGDWTVFGPGGMAAVCPLVVTVSIPSRLATIVG